jgi:hypothetical protein
MSWLITGSQKVNWDPSLISTALWLDAADASTVTTVSDAVSQWNDKSGNNRHATQSTAGSRPGYGSVSLNGKLGVVFNSKFMNTTYATGTLSAVSCIFVAQAMETPATSTVRVLCANHQSGAPRDGFSLTSSNGFLDLTKTLRYDASLPTGQVIRVNAALASAIDGSNPFIGFGSATSQTSSANMTLGQFTTGPGGTLFPGDFRLYEIIFTSTINDTNRQRLEGYLAHKWGLTANLPGDHPFKVNPPAP